MTGSFGRILAGAIFLVTSACRTDAHHEAPSAPLPQSPALPSGAASAGPALASAVAPAAPALGAWPRARPARIETDWCIGGVDTLDEETCLVVPDEPTTTLLVYFHGIVPPTRESPQKTNYQTVVASVARRLPIVALMPRRNVRLGRDILVINIRQFL